MIFSKIILRDGTAEPSHKKNILLDIPSDPEAL